MNNNIVAMATVTVLERDIATSVRPYAPAGVMQPIEDDWAIARVEVVVEQFVPEIESLLGVPMELDDDVQPRIEIDPKSGALRVRFGLVSFNPIGGVT